MESQIVIDPAEVPAVSVSKTVNWNQVGAYIALTFGFTWLLDLILFLTGGLTSPAVSIALQFQMLLPAFSAMLLGMFFFKNSPIYLKNNQTKSKWFTWYFLFFSLLYAAATVASFLKPELAMTLSSLMLLPGLIGMILVLVLRAVGGKDTFASVGMGGGKAKLWLLFGLGILLFTGSQPLLNWLFNLGEKVDLAPLLAQGAAAGMPATVFMIVITVQTVLLGPFLGLLIAFGEEYGWRGYLQPALMGLGRVRGVGLLGVIWGIWHWPVIWMGYNYPGRPILGSLLMVVFCIGLGYVLGYAVLKGKGIWIAAFLHALVNQSSSFFMGIVYAPKDLAFSFGIGIPGLIMLGLVVLWILRDPIWKENA